MALLYHIMKILDLADDDGRAVRLVVALDGRFIGRAAIHGDLFVYPVTANRLLQKAQRGRLVSLRGEEEIDGLARFVHGERDSATAP